MALKTFSKVFKNLKPIIGMIHVPALPGTPKNVLKPNAIILSCINEALKLTKAGVDGIMIENMHDVPYLNRKVGPEIIGLLSIIVHEVKKISQLPCGIQILAGANKAALAVAYSGGLDFVRAEGFVFGHLADEGYMDSDAGELLRFRKNIGAEDILIFTDIKKKHSSHAITADTSFLETAKAANYFLSDGVIVTGKSTASAANPKELEAVKKEVSIPVLIGSGISEMNLEVYFQYGDGFIVGSSIKYDGNWENDIDPERLQKLVQKAKTLRIKI